jgi:tetratricopeptide (TPR) repeat protein
MTLRFRTASATAAALVLGLSLAATGCGKYSMSALKAQKAYKQAVEYYKASDWKQAASNYEYTLQQNPNKVEAYFYLGNSYDNMYKPSRVGEPENDSYMLKAIDNYQKAAERDPNPQMKKLALEYLVAAYGQEKLNAPEKAEPIVQRMIQMDPNEPGNYFALMSIYEGVGRYDEAEVAIQKAISVKPNDATVYTTASGFYNRQGDFEKTMDSLKKAAELAPNDPQGFQLMATYYWEKVYKDHRLTSVQKKQYLQEGLTATDKALALNPDYFDALSFKNLLLRLQGNEETDLAKRAAIYKQADQLRDRAIELQKKKATGAR